MHKIRAMCGDVLGPRKKFSGAESFLFPPLHFCDIFYFIIFFPFLRSILPLSMGQLPLPGGNCHLTYDRLVTLR